MAEREYSNQNHNFKNILSSGPTCVGNADRGSFRHYNPVSMFLAFLLNYDHIFAVGKPMIIDL
ncbi:MAG: hypothetical protein ACXWE6_14070, partial [Nitrososphaeraceae archaeon]